MNKSFTQTDKTMNDKAEISRVPLRTRAHALFEHACAYHTLKTLLLNALAALVLLIGVGAGNRVWGQRVDMIERTTQTNTNNNGNVTRYNKTNGDYNYHTWTVPATVTKFNVHGIGGGGGGGCGFGKVVNSVRATAQVAGSGGGGGAYDTARVSRGNTSVFYLYVGAGGSGGTINSSEVLTDGGSGNATWFNSSNSDQTPLMKANGGNGGTSAKHTTGQNTQCDCPDGGIVRPEMTGGWLCESEIPTTFGTGGSRYKSSRGTPGSDGNVGSDHTGTSWAKGGTGGASGYSGYIGNTNYTGGAGECAQADENGDNTVAKKGGAGTNFGGGGAGGASVARFEGRCESGDCYEWTSFLHITCRNRYWNVGTGSSSLSNSNLNNCAGGSGANGVVWLEYITAQVTSVKISCGNSSDGRITIQVNAGTGLSGDAAKFTLVLKTAAGVTVDTKTDVSLSDESTYEFTGLAAGTYVVTVTQKSSQCECEVTNIVVDNEENAEILSVALDEDEVCQGTDVTFTATLDDGDLNTVDKAATDVVWTLDADDCPSVAYLNPFYTVPTSTSGCNVSIDDEGNLETTNTDDDGKAKINLLNIGSFNPNLYRYFLIRYRVTSSGSNGPGDLRIYFYDNEYNDTYSSNRLNQGLINDGNWHIMTINASGNGYWSQNGNKTGFQLRPSTVKGAKVAIDYLALTNFPATDTSDTYVLSTENLTPGQHVVYATRLGGCQEIACEQNTVTVHDSLEAGNIGTGTTTICAGQISAIEDLELGGNDVSGGVPYTGADESSYYVYKWYVNDGETESEISGANQPIFKPYGLYGNVVGTYVFTRKVGDNFCNKDELKLSEGSYTLVVNPVPTITVSEIKEVTCYENQGAQDLVSDGAIAVTWSGGTAPLTYSFSSDAVYDNSTHTFSQLTQGTYTLTVTDSKECSVSQEIEVPQPENPLSYSVLSVKPERCSQKGSVQMTVTGSHPNYTISWQGSTVSDSMEDVPENTSTTISNLISQSYTFTVTDDKECFITLPLQTIDQLAAWEPDVEQPLEKTVCNNTPFAFTMTELNLQEETDEQITFHWTVTDGDNYNVTGAGTSLGGTLQNNGTTSKTYTYSFTVQKGLFCYSGPYEATVTVLPGSGNQVSFDLDDIDVCPNLQFETPHVTFSGAPSTATVTWKFDYNNQQTVPQNITGGEMYTTFLAPNVCEGSYKYYVTVNDGLCSATKDADVTVSVPDLTIDESQYEKKTVTCMTDVVPPHLGSGLLPSNEVITTTCGIAPNTYTTAPATRSENPVITRTGTECDGTVTYTYTYTLCNGSTADWKYIYTVKDNIKPRVKNNVDQTLNIELPVQFKYCAFVYPDVTSIMRDTLIDNCTAPDDLVITQTPAAGTPISQTDQQQPLSINVTVSDLCGNDTSFQNAVSFTVPAKLTVDLNAVSNVTCFDSLDGSISVVVKRAGQATTESGLKYKWDNNTSTGQTEVLSKVGSGMHSVQVTDDYGCSAFVSGVVTQPSAIRATVVPSSTGLCEGEAITLYASVSGRDDNNYTYAWKNKYADTLMCTTCTSTLSVRDSGTYVLSVIHGTDNCPNNNTDNFSKVQLHKVPQVTIKPSDTAICKNGGVAKLTATSMKQVTYRWSSNVASNQITNDSIANVSAPGIYSVTVTSDTSGCSNTAMAVVSVNDPHVELNNITIYNHVSNDEDDELDEDEEDGYVVCNGTTVMLVADTSNVVGTPTITWKYWKPGDDEDAVPEPSQVSSSTYHPLLRNLTDTTKFKLIVSAQIGKCTVSDSDSVIVNVLPAFNAGTINAGNASQQVCYGTPDEDIPEIAVTAATGGQTPPEYRWIHFYDDDSDTSAVSQEPGFTFAGNYGQYPGTHTFKREARDQNETCNSWTPSTGEYVLTVDEPFSAGAISTTGQSVCYKGDVNAIGNVENASGAHGTITYTWLHKLANDETWTLIDTAPHTPTFTPTSYNLIPGRHYFTRVATNGACNVKDTTDNPYLLQVQEELVLTIPEVEEICAKPSDNSSLDNNVLTLTETAGTTTNYTYSWTVGEANANISGANTQTVNVSWPESGTGHLTLEVTMKDQPYCVSRRLVTVTVNAVPAPTISGNDAVCQNSPVTLTVTPDDLTTYHWTSFGGGTATAGATDNVKEVSWTDPGNHTVEVKVTDGNGCSAKAEKFLTVNELPALECINTTPASCNGGTNGVIKASVTNATNSLPPFIYTVGSNSIKTDTLSNLDEDYSVFFEGFSFSTNGYVVTVTDDRQCQAQTTVTVDEAADFTVTDISVTPTSCQSNDGAYAAKFKSDESGGYYDVFIKYHQDENTEVTVYTTTINYNLYAQGAEVPISCSNLKPGAYTMTVSRSINGVPSCSKAYPFEVMADNTLLTVTIPEVSPKCVGDGFETEPHSEVTISTSAGPAVMDVTSTTAYSWFMQDDTPQSSNSEVFDENLENESTDILTQTYVVTATYINCTVEKTFVVEVWPAVTVEQFSGNVTVCPEIREVELAAQFNHVMGNDNNTVTWTFNDEASEHTPLTATDNLLADGVTISLPNAYDATYPYTVNFTDGVCSASAQGTVTVPAKLEMVVDNVKMISCRYDDDGRVKLHANGGTSPYKFTLHINNPDYGADSIQNNVTTNVEFGHLYLPEDRQNGTTDNGDQILYGFYSVSVEDNNGCSINDEVRVWAPDTMVWLYVPDPISLCCNSGETIDITVGPGGIIDPTPKLSQLLTFQSGKTLTYFTGETVGVGSYNYSLQSYDVCKSKGTSLKKSIKVTVYANPSITFHLDNNEEDFSVQTVCSGEAIQDIQIDSSYAKIDSVPGLPQGVSYANGVISGTPASVTKDTTYNFTVYASSNQATGTFAGCGSVTLSGSITVNPAPTVELEVVSNVSCTGGDGEIKATYQNGLPNHNHIFIALDDSSHDYIYSNNTTKNFTGLTHGEHSVTVWTEKYVENVGLTEGCSATATIDVPLNSPYNDENPFVFSPITTPNICSGGEFNTTPVAPVFDDYITTYKWSAPTGEVTGGAASTSAQDDVTGTLSNATNTLQNAVYSVTPTTGNVCEGPAFTVTVPVNPTVVMNRPASQTVCSDSTIAAIVFGTNITDGAMSYSWSRTNTTGITGLGESGAGNIAATALKNTTTEAQTTTITVTPTYTYTDGTVSCTGDTVKFTITVNPEVILTANNEANLEQTKTYGTAINDVTFSFSSHATLTHTNLPAGLTFSNNTLSGTPTAAGDHTVTFTATSTQEPNCGKKELTVTIHVEKALLTVTTQDNTKVYGQSDPQPLTTATIDGLVNNDTEAAIRELLQLSFSRATGENVGEYAISATGNSLNNYEVTYQNTGKLSITNAAVTVKAVAQTKTYGAADPTLTATVSGLQHNDAASVITYTVSRVAGENVGEYVITPIGAAVQGNYTVTYDTAKFTITRADLTVKADNKTKPFGTADPTLTATVSGLVNGDAANAISYTLSRAEANTTAGENAGTYVITPTGAAVQGNYNVTYETGTLTITPINITVTVTGNTAVVAYTGSTQSVTGYTAVADNSNYDVSHVVYTGTAIAEGVGSANGDATYPMTLNLNQFSNNDPNYNVTFSKVDGWLRIVPEGTVIVNITGHTLTTNYDAQAHSVSGYDVEIVAPNNTNYSTSDFTFNGQAALNKTNAGVYPMGLAAAQFVNTNTNVDNVIFNVTDGKLTINKVNAEVTITGNHDSRLYDGAEHTIADYVVSNANPAFYTESDFTFSGTATATRTNAGTTYMGLADNQFANSNPNFEHVTFHVTDGYQTIQPIQVAVTVTGHTKMHEFTTGLQKVTGYEMESNSALFSKDYVVFSGDSTASGTTVGTYPMGLLASQFSYNNPNLQVTFSVTDGWLEIVPAGIVIVNITGHTSTKDYNCAEQSVSGYEVEIGGVTDDPEPVSYATIYNENYFSLVSTATATAKGTNAGTYYMGLDATKFENNNDQFYVQFHVTDGSLTIKKVNASVTITGKTDEVTYNGAAHTVTGYTVSNAQPTCYNTDYIHFTGSIADSTATRTDFGTTDMNLVPGLFQNTNPNFEVVTFTVVNGKMTVNKASMDIAVNGSNTSRVYTGQLQTYIGAAEATSSNTGFNAAKFGYSGGTTVSGTAAGNYTMALSSSSCSYNDANYNVNWTIGDPVKLTITKAPITLNCPDVNDLTQTYNGSELHPAATAHGVNDQDLIKIEYSTDNGSTWSTTVPGITNVSTQHVDVRASNANYDTVTCDYTLKVEPAAITIKADAKTKVYDNNASTDPGLTATVTGKPANGVDPDYSVSRVAGQTVGEYVISVTAEATSNPNYTVTVDTALFKITPAAITIKADAKSKTYDNNASTDPELTATVTGKPANGVDPDYSVSRVAGQNVGEYVISVTADATSNPNYTVTVDTALFKITPAAITIKADAKTKVYDNDVTTDPGLTATVTNKPANGVIPDYSVSRVAGQTVGEYVISVTAEATSNPNYTVTVDTALFKITPAAITIKADAKSKTYDNNASTDPELTATVTGKPANGVDPDYSVSRVAGQNVGEYVISVTADATSNPNYTVTVDTALFKITPAAITIKADAKTKVYDNDVTTDPGLTATVTGKPANGVDPDYSVNRVAGQNVGEYVISVTADATSNPNYTVTVDTALFKITPAAITIKADAKTKVYDNNTNSDPELTATVTGKPANGVTPDYSVSRVAGQNVGEYVISVTAEATSNPNYTVTVDTALFKITPAALTIKVNTEKVYDASPLVTSFGNDGVSIEGNATGAYLTAGAVTTNGSTVGDYTYAANTVTINPAFAMSDGISNYTVSYDITMKIKENELTMYCPVNQADTQKVYDGTPISYTVTAVAGSSNALVEYSTDNNTWSSTTVPSRTDAGETVVYVRASADNYAMKYCHFTLKVTPKPVTVTITGNHDSKTYDATLHTVEGYTATANSTLYVTDDNPDFGLAAGQTAKAIRTTVGTTNMGLTTAMFVNNNPNFDVTFAIAADGYMTITKATLTITANDQTHTYTATAQGENNAIYTSASDLSAKVSVSGLKGNDALTKIKLNGQETNVNVYADKILPSDAAIGTATGNYDINYVAGKLTITRAEATVFANNLSKTYGDADPTLTATVTGVLGTDALNYTLTRDEGDNVGTYAINVTPGSNPNYSVSAQGGQFTIKRRPLTITVNTSKYYDGSALVTSYNDEGVTITGNAGTAQLTAGKVTTNGTAVGTYTNASNATNTVTINTPFAMSDNIQNYSVTTNITMEIQKNTINMTCTDTAKTYDNISFNHPIPATVATGETVTVEYSTNNTTWSGTAPSLTDFGSQTVYVRATADNYEPKTCSYNMTVNKRYVKIITHGGIHLYDGNSFNIPNNYTIEGDGFLEADVVASSFQTPATVTTLGTCVTDTIIYETTSSFKPNDYTIEYQLGQLCISGNAPITITSASVNPNAPIYYDGQLHGTEPQYRTYVVTYDGDIMPTVANSNGLKFKLPAGDTVTITPTFTGVTFYDDVNDTAQNNVFTYTITHDAFYVGTRTVNYGTVNITKRPITFTIDPSLAFKTYDGSILTVNASDLTVGGQGLATGDALTAGVVKTEDYVVGEYTCAEGGFQVGVNGVAIKEGFVITHPSGHNSTSSYVPKFENVKLSITPMTNFECPAAQTFTLVEGTSQMSLTESQLGTPTLEGGAAIPSYVTASSNIAGLTLTEGDHSVTWTFSDANGYEMATCTQTVTVQYAPCDTITYLDHDYPAKRVGSQCWLTENLRADIGADYHSYKDESGNYDKFGYLYSWYTAMGVDEGDVNAVPTPALTADNGTQYFQGICPAGWAVPSMSDIAELSNYVGTVSRLKDPSTQYWLPGYEGDTEGNTDFNARGAGRYNAANNRYEDLMTGFHFWAADATPGTISILSACIAYHCDTLILTEPNQKNDRKSVRCVRKHVE